MQIITQIAVQAHASLVTIRNRLMFIANELGMAEIRASRMASACSQAGRYALEQGVFPVLEIGIEPKGVAPCVERYLSVTFRPWVNTDEQQLQQFRSLLDRARLDEGALVLSGRIGHSDPDEERYRQIAESMQRQVIPSRAELEMQATHDGLTHLLNRHALEPRLKDEFQRAQRYHQPLSVLMLDIDHFKRVNDTYGHLGGDACLIKLSAMLRENARKQDIVARFGGEEFVLVLPHSEAEPAAMLAERIRGKMENMRIAHDGQDICCTISIGIATITAHIADEKMLLDLADQALYEAKESGRNRVCIHN